MQSNERLQRVLATRQLCGAQLAGAVPQGQPRMLDDLRLFALTFACGFLFTSIFIA